MFLYNIVYQFWQMFGWTTVIPLRHFVSAVLFAKNTTCIEKMKCQVSKWFLD